MANPATRIRIDVSSVRGTLGEIHRILQDVVNEIGESHKRLPICNGYQDFLREQPGTWLDSAKKRLDKKEYKVAFVGPYKAGKSTFISALFKQPEMLPAQDRECTFAVSIVSCPAPGQSEHINITYFSSEEALRNLLGNLAFRKLLVESETDGECQKILNNFSPERAVDFLRERAEKYKSGALQMESAQLFDFLKAYREYGERLGREHNDSIANLDLYVRKPDDIHIGHLLLIKTVQILRHNDVLQANNFQIADTPGIDTLNRAARDITLNYLSSADAVVYVGDAKGLTTSFADVRDQLEKFHNSVKNKMFIVANRADWYDAKTMKRDKGDRPGIEGIFDDIVGKLQALGLNESRLHFTCGRFNELHTKREKGGLADSENVRYNELRTLLDERLHALDPGVNPFLHTQLTACFTDGGIPHFRKGLVDYLQYDIQVERLREVFADLKRTYASLCKLLDPERARLNDIRASLGPISQQITQFFTQAKNQFVKNIAAISKGARKAVDKLMDEVRVQMERAVSEGVEAVDFEAIGLKLPMDNPKNRKEKAIELCKAEFSDTFARIVREVVTPVVRAGVKEQVDASRVGEVLQHLALGFKSDFDAKYRGMMDSFNSGLTHFMVMRTREETWGIMDTVMTSATFDPEWNDKVEQAFRGDLKKIFTERFNAACEKLKAVLARHYQGLIRDLGLDLEKLLDEVSAAIKRDPDRVSLPVSILTGTGQESESDVKQRYLLSYFAKYDELRKVYEATAPSLS